MITGILYRKYKNLKKQKKKLSQEKMRLTLRGGGFIDQCLDPRRAYEITHTGLELMIKKMLNLPDSHSGPIVISARVLFLCTMIWENPIYQINLFGISIFIDKAKDLGLKIILGAAGGAIFYVLPLGITSLTAGLLAAGVSFGIIQNINNYDCERLLSEVTMDQYEERIIGFLDKPKEKNPRIFIKDNENIELYIPIFDKSDHCVTEAKQELQKANVKTEQQISRRCDKKYIPLKERTKTLRDLKRYDSTENLNKIKPYEQRYEKRKQRFIKERQSCSSEVNFEE